MHSAFSSLLFGSRFNISQTKASPHDWAMVGRVAILVAQLALVGRCMIRSISSVWKTSHIFEVAVLVMKPVILWTLSWIMRWRGQSVNLLSQLAEPTIFRELCCLGQCCELPQARVLQKLDAVVQNSQDICFFVWNLITDLLRLVISCWLKALIACRPIEEILECDSIAYDILYVWFIHMVKWISYYLICSVGVGNKIFLWWKTIKGYPWKKKIVSWLSWLISSSSPCVTLSVPVSHTHCVFHKLIFIIPSIHRNLSSGRVNLTLLLRSSHILPTFTLPSMPM